MIKKAGICALAFVLNIGFGFNECFAILEQTTPLSDDGSARGLVLETYSYKDGVQSTFSAVRVNPKDYLISLESAPSKAEWKSSQEWRRTKDFAGAINASKFHDNGAATGYLKKDGQIIQKKMHRSFGGFLGLGLVGEPNAVSIFHSEDNNREENIGKYSTVIQLERLFDQNGDPIKWAFAGRIGISAVGMDGDSNFVFLHATTPFQPTEFAKALKENDSDLKLKSALLTTSGLRASFCVGDYELVSDYPSDSFRSRIPGGNYLPAIDVPGWILPWIPESVLSRVGASRKYPHALCFQVNE